MQWTRSVQRESRARGWLTASEDDTAALINRISALQGIDSVEEISDLMPHMDDPDSNSAGLSDDIGLSTARAAWAW